MKEFADSSNYVKELFVQRAVKRLNNSGISMLLLLLEYWPRFLMLEYPWVNKLL